MEHKHDFKITYVNISFFDTNLINFVFKCNCGELEQIDLKGKKILEMRKNG